MRWWIVVVVFAACGPPRSAPDALPSCWSLDCPTDPGARVCGTCKDWTDDHECPPGFVCARTLECVHGPRNITDGGPTDAHVGPDADPFPDADVSPDARRYDWSTCDDDGGTI
jgi:hypothetical protein